MPTYRSASGSSAEDLFIELFSDTFGAEKAGYLYSQYPFSDIYQNSRFADFLIENGGRKVAIEIDDEASHNPKLVSQNKFYDDLLKQNSMIYLGWDVYRWAVRQMQQQPETVKDELRVQLQAQAGPGPGADRRLPGGGGQERDLAGLLLHGADHRPPAGRDLRPHVAGL